jgi:hypothetical protein
MFAGGADNDLHSTNEAMEQKRHNPSNKDDAPAPPSLGI